MQADTAARVGGAAVLSAEICRFAFDFFAEFITLLRGVRGRCAGQRAEAPDDAGRRR